jgi:hypothetical protein
MNDGARRAGQMFDVARAGRRMSLTRVTLRRYMMTGGETNGDFISGADVRRMSRRASLCQREVDRRVPHVSIGMLEFEDVSQPWPMSARVLDDRELAVYCADCATPETAVRAESADVTAQ